jgi:hypothetical protein
MSASKTAAKKALKSGKNKTKKRDPYSFQSLLRNPAVRTLCAAKKGKSEPVNKRKSKFYESLVLDTKPTNPKKEPDVRAYVLMCIILIHTLGIQNFLPLLHSSMHHFLNSAMLTIRKVMSDPDFPQESLNYVGETLLEFKKSLLDGMSFDFIRYANCDSSARRSSCSVSSQYTR